MQRFVFEICIVSKKKLTLYDFPKKLGKLLNKPMIMAGNIKIKKI